MTFAASVPYALLVLFGAALIVAAFNARRLVRWENRALTSLADAVRDYRVNLEEEQRLLQGKPAHATAPAQEAQGSDIDIWAA
jgi:Flp pilus assembly pilin Flp